MGERTRYAPGTPSWVDVTCPDPSVVAPFYRDLFGWMFESAPGGRGTFRLDGRRVAGVAPLGAGVPAWRTFVTVRDAGRIVEVAVAGGATVLAPVTTMGGEATIALLADPAGAVFGIWEPGAVAGAELVNDLGALCWSELMTPDPRAATSFYTALLGWQPELDRDDPRSIRWMLGDRSIAGMRRIDGSGPLEGAASWLASFAVADVAEVAARAAVLGGTVVVPGAAMVSGGDRAVLADPAGAVFGVLRLDELDD